MKLENYSEETLVYELSQEYSIERAEAEEYGIYLLTYGDRERNKYAIKDWDMTAAYYTRYLKDIFWIKKKDKRVGGVRIKPNLIAEFFTIPPFEETFSVLKLLKELLIHWSDCEKDVITYGIYPEMVENYLRLGFRRREARQWMIRPTESYAVQWEDNFTVVIPEKHMEQELGRLYYEAHFGGIEDDGSGIEKKIEDTKYYFENKFDCEIARKASTVIYDNNTKELIGACLIAIYEGWPLIFDLAVKPGYQGKGIAEKMIKQALTVLKEEYRVLVLYVTLGNNAQQLYHKLGFAQGTKYEELYIPKSIG